MLKHLKAVAVAGITFSLAACQAQSGTSPFVGGASFVAPQKIADSATQQSVAYQINTEHTGFARGPLKRPLKILWSVELPVGDKTMGYPVIANGIVVVTAYQHLIALDEKTGKQLWSLRLPSGGYGWLGPAYDNGKIFASGWEAYGRGGCGVCAFDQKTGKKLWSAPALGQSFITAPLTAAGGRVYTSGVGGGGTVYAYDESNGALQWSASVLGGDDSSPVVTPNGIFVSYACPQAYDFEPKTGNQIWHYEGPCEGGGGSTPVLYDGLLFVGDSDVSAAYNGLILNAANGKAAGQFNSEYTPAFANNLGFFLTDFRTLEALSIPKMKKAWGVELPSSDSFSSPALVIGNIAYLLTAKDTLVGYDIANGKQKVSIGLSNGTGNYGRGMAYGDGELIVPTGHYLVALKGS